MHYNSTALLEDLQSDIRMMILRTEQLKGLPGKLLLQAPAPGKWSPVQVLEHLNSYGRYYLPALSKALKSEKAAVPDFKPGWLGDYFTRMMKPGKDGKIGNRMNAPKDHTPVTTLDADQVIRTFLVQQQQLLTLLEEAKSKNITAIRVPISISRMIRLKAGDTFRFLIAHQQRHFIQLENALKQLGTP